MSESLLRNYFMNAAFFTN